MLPLTRTLGPEDQVLFLHIPKSGGNTLSAILDEHFLPDQICPVNSWYELPKGPSDLSPYRLLRGHVFYDIWKVLSGMPVFITMLREPIERTISHYEMMRRTPGHPLYEPLQHMDLTDCVNHPEVRLCFENIQTRFLSSCFEIQSVRDNASACEQIPADSLQIAKERLEQFAFVGLMERFRESADLLCYTFGWRHCGPVPELNVSPPDRLRREDIPGSTLDQVRNLTQWDAELYQFAQQLFKVRLNQMMADLLEKHAEHHYVQTHVARVRSVDFRFEEMIAGQGWYQQEFAPHHGYYRWTGPETCSTLDFPLTSDTDMLVQFRVIAVLAPDILEGVGLRVNDRPIALQSRTDENGTVFQGVVPRTLLATPFTRFTFEVKRTIYPGSVGLGNRDPRRLGIAVNWFSILPKVSNDN